MKLFPIFLLLFFCATLLNAQVDPTIFDKYEGQKITIDGYNIHLEVKGEGNPIFFLPCLLYTSPSPRDQRGSRMPSSA